MQQLVLNNYKRQHKFEITQVLKEKPKENHAWIITTSLAQRDRVLKRKFVVNNELICPMANNLEKLIEVELAKKNCLMLIAINLNIHKNIEEVE